MIRDRFAQALEALQDHAAALEAYDTRTRIAGSATAACLDTLDVMAWNGRTDVLEPMAEHAARDP